jgi:hypothetical protein
MMENTMKNVKYVLAGSLLFLATAANAVVPASSTNKGKEEHKEMTGDGLAYFCMANVPGNPAKVRDNGKRANQCNAFISGWDKAAAAFSTEYFCSPTITFKDMSIVFIDYLVSHKEARELPAAKSLMTAFQAKWPCARGPREGGSVDEAVSRAQEEINKEKRQ